MSGLADTSPSSFRIRLGIGLVVLSWVPFAQVVIAVGSMSESRAHDVRLAIWSVQVVVGLVGVAIAGKPTVDIVEQVGWRRAPRVIWNLLWHADTRLTTP